VLNVFDYGVIEVITSFNGVMKKKCSTSKPLTLSFIILPTHPFCGRRILIDDNTIKRSY